MKNDKLIYRLLFPDSRINDMAALILRISISGSDICRTMKIETNQTVAQVIKQIAKRNPLAQESDNFSLFLPPKTSSDSGIWLDESRTLESYNLVEKVRKNY